MIAQEVEKVCSDCVITDANGVKTLNTDPMFFHMINSIQELSAKNTAIEARIAALERKMSSFKLKHSSGNGTSFHSPAANPSADITLKVPSTTGSAGQVLKVASANHSSTNAELEWGSSAVTGTSGTDNFTVADGNLVIGTSGHGIDFSATADESGSAASMDSELLDDYEEGEWTPDLTFSTSSTGISYSYRGGRYIKVGNLVHCSAYIYLSSRGSGSGYAEISLPITPLNAAPGVTHAQGGFCTESGAWANSFTSVFLRVRGDAARSYVQCNTSDTNHHAYADRDDYTDTTKMVMTFIYRST